MNHYFTDNDDLRSEIRVLKYSYEDAHFSFSSDLGVFSKDKIDFGTKTLIESYFLSGRKNVNMLDVGCGYGIIGITMSKIMNAKVDMIDVSKRALHLCKMNIKKNEVDAKCFFSDMYQNIDSKYDVIITNPPIRAGKEIYLNIINNSFDYLNENGELWFVMNKKHGVKTVIKNLEKTRKVTVLSKNKGFYVVLVK